MSADRAALAVRVASLAPDQRAALLGLLGGGGAPQRRMEAIRPRTPPGSPAPLSFGQQRLWLIDQLAAGVTAYNETNLLCLPHAVDAAALRWAMDEVLRRHEVLRSRFPFVGDQPMQVPLSALSIEVPLVDLRHLPTDAREAEAMRLAADQARLPLDLATESPVRAALFRLAPDQHRLALTVHHIATDGWSLGVFVVELLALYWTRVRGQPSPLPEPHLQYADFAIWQRRSLDGSVLAPQLAYWRRRLAALPRVDLPSDRPRPRVFSHQGKRLPLVLAPALEQALMTFAGREGTTLNIVLLAGLFALLRRLSGQEDLTVGCPAGGRHRSELEPLMGFFVNTLVLRADLAGDPTFTVLVGRVRDVLVAALAHQDVPFERLVDELLPVRDRSHSPFFQVMFHLFQAPGEGSLPPELDQPMMPVDAGSAKFDLTFELIRKGTGTRGHIEYSTDLFDRTRIERIASQYLLLLESAAADPACPVSRLRLLSPADEHRILVDWNRTAMPYPRDATIPGVFLAQAKATQDTSAVRCAGQSLSYRELAARAARASAKLHALGVRRGDLVGLYLERGLDLPTALLGILGAGAAYVPLDTAYPRERLEHLLADSGVQIVVASDPAAPELSGFEGQVVDVAGLLTGRASRKRLPASWALEDLAPDDLAYVMYTSGTTGEPKGVAVTHRNVLRLTKSGGYADWKPGQASMQFAPLSFDASTLEIWGSLLNGGTLVLHPPGVPTLAELGAFIRTERLELVFLTTPIFRQLLESHAADLRGVGQLLTGGEAMSVASARAAWRALPRTRIVNCYGPTECTVIGCAWRVAGPDIPDTGVPIGKPIANTTAYILDSDGNPVPEGVPGELWLGGDGVAASYWRRPSLTEACFLPDRFSGQAGARLYRTGDLAAWREDGNIQFLGRADRQVKLSGYRIELAEVEAVMEAHPGVSTAVALLAGGEAPRLVGIAARRQGMRLTDTELRRFLAERLPKHMIPGVLDVRDRMPTTPAGKLDHAALAAAAEAPAVGRIVGGPPRTAVERQMAELWAKLLNAEAIGRTDNFFDLGGHSLVAMQLLSRVRAAFGTEVTMADFFDDPTIAGLASLLEAETARA